MPSSTQKLSVVLDNEVVSAVVVVNVGGVGFVVLAVV
jgi:hypothetical protein